MSDYGFERWAEEEIEQLRSGLDLQKPGPFQSLFRYVSLNNKSSWSLLERMLQKSELVGSTAHGLNDPFELSPVRFDDLSPTTLPTESDISRILRGERPEKPDKATEATRIDGLRERAIEFLDRRISDARVIAFSQQSQSGLLWSHYANSYRGACLHFMARGLSRIRGRLAKVTYSRYRPTYPLSLAVALSKPVKPGASSSLGRQSIRMAESDKMLFFTKSEDWTYEAEVRIIYDIKQESSITFRPDAFASIILGPRMSDEDASRLRELMNQSPYAGIPLRRARLSSTTFSVEQDDQPVLPAF